VPVGGRLEPHADGWQLVDRSAAVPLAVTPADGRAGDLVQGVLSGDPARPELREARCVARRRGSPPPADRTLPGRLDLLAARDRVVRSIRAFFHERGFLEVDTPSRVVCPGLEPHLVAQPAGGRWLATSPELHLKRLLVAGAERVFELARAWRGEERGDWHLGEFTLLEWYRAWEGLDALVADVAALLPAAARAAGRDPAAVGGCDLTAPVERLTVREAVRRHTGLDLAALRDRADLAGALDAEGIATDTGDDWDELFFRLFLARVEPHLGRERITVLEEYPASQAALARVRHDPHWPVALRFEVYAAGLELANAFDELTDPIEQRRRHEADRAARRAHGREVPPLDEDFLAALASGHPPAAGIALGIDRLVALVLGLGSVREAVAFPNEL
jgi:lysyl-tRNA synthetase class 2